MDKDRVIEDVAIPSEPWRDGPFPVPLLPLSGSCDIAESPCVPESPRARLD